MLSCTGTNINDPVALFYCLFIMFNNQDRVTQVAKTDESVNKATIISLMQTNARFIENIERANQTRTNLTCQANALCFTASQGAGCSRQGEIIETNVKQESESCVNFLCDAFRNDRITIVQNKP